MYNLPKYEQLKQKLTTKNNENNKETKKNYSLSLITKRDAKQKKRHSFTQLNKQYL